MTMTKALYIGGGSPEHVYRLLNDFAEVLVLSTEEERREFWCIRKPAALQVMVAEPLAINVEVQTNFRQAFDAVYIDNVTPALRKQAELFCKPTGSIGVRNSGRRNT